MEKKPKRELYNVNMYFCPYCDQSHQPLSYIGKKHLQYARPEQKRRIFLEIGIYPK